MFDTLSLTDKVLLAALKEDFISRLREPALCQHQFVVDLSELNIRLLCTIFKMICLGFICGLGCEF